MAELLFQDPCGIKIYRQDFKHRSQVKVVFEQENHSHHLRTYRFDNIPDIFESPYCSWTNLAYCGGWSCSDESYLDTAVQSGKKLYAGRFTHLKAKYSPNAPTLEEAKSQFLEFQSTMPTGIVAGVEELILSDDMYLRTYICRTGKISDYFSLDEVFSFYAKHRLELPETWKKEVRRLCDYEIQTYGSKDAPFNYARANSPVELIVTGLLLGYPLESTISLLYGY